MMYIGQRIARLRSERGIKQVELAQRAGMRVGYLSDLETGRKPNPTINTLAAIATALDVPVTALVQEDAAQPAA